MLEQVFSLCDLFEEYLVEFGQGQSHTAKAKRTDIRHFLDFLGDYLKIEDKQEISSKDFTASTINAFTESRLQSGEAPSTVARRLATIKHFARMASQKVPTFLHASLKVRSPKFKANKPKSLSDEIVKEITYQSTKKTLLKDTYKAHRDRTIIALLLATGLRADEIRVMRRGQVNDELTWFKRVRTKGRQFRNVYISSDVRKTLNNFLEYRLEELRSKFSPVTSVFDSSLPLFVSLRGAKRSKPDSFRMNPKTLWRIVNKSLPGVGLHPHLMRHTFATQLLESCHDIRLVAQALGHSDVRTTMKYTERADQDVADALEKYRGEDE